MSGIAAHHFIKISLLQGYITDRNFDIICLPEIFLNPSPGREDDKLKIEGYNLIRSNYPGGLKKGGASRDDLCSLSNYLVTEIRLENEKSFFTSLYRSSCQYQHGFENFYTNLDTLVDHINNKLPTCSVVIGD